jgi:FkbM family methyltransferase
LLWLGPHPGDINQGTSIPALKSQIQRILKQAGIYQRLKASPAYDLYWSLADRSVRARAKSEIGFYRDLLRGFSTGGLIFDVGANDGTKTGIFLSLGARVVAVEPDRTNQQILKEKYLTYRLARKPVIIVGKALSDRDSIETMWIDEPGSAKNTLSWKWVETLKHDDKRFGCHHDFCQQTTVETTTLDKLVAAHGLPFFIKIDVEGHEVSVLRGLHSKVPYLSFEVNLPEFLPDGLECVKMLDRLETEGKFNYVAGDYARGLAHPEWLSSSELSRALGQCSEKSIEVIWKTQESPLA